MKKINWKKSVSLLGLLVVLQPTLLNAEAVTVIKDAVTESDSKDKKDDKDKKDKKDSATDSSEAELKSPDLTTSAQVTETVEASSETKATEATSETKASETKATEKSEATEKTEKTEETEATEKTEDTEDADDKLDKENEKLRAEVRATRPEKSNEEIIAALPSDVMPLDGVFDTESLGAISSSKTHIDKAPNGGDVVFMTDASLGDADGQSSALWSYQGAKVNMKKPFETEMYVYLGNSQFGSADGMSFTFQNDARGTKAIGQNGGALGVYGNIDEKRKPSSGTTGWGKPSYGDTMEKFIQEGVQKSFAVEMDTSANAVFDGGEGWNGYTKRQHMLLSYPAHTKFAAFNKEKIIGLIDTGRWSKEEPIEQYGMKETGWFAGKYRPYMYNGAVGSAMFTSTNNSIWGGPYLSDGAWHTLKVQYTPKDRKSSNKNVKVDAPDFKITFDGKTKDYTGRFAPFQNGLVTEDDPYMYWGMTAATGASAATQAIAFKNIPKTVGIDHTSDIEKDGKSIIDMEAEDYTHVKSGDELSYETSSHYATGDKEFEAPVFTETIDSNLDLVTDSFEVLENGATEYVKVPADQFTFENGTLTYKLKSNLSIKNPDFKTRFKVKVKPTYYETLVTEESKIASTEEFISSSEDLTYIIDPLQVEGKVTLEEMTDNPDITKTVKGKVEINKDYANQKVKVQLAGDPRVKDLEPVEVQLDGNGVGNFEIPFTEDLTAGSVITATAEHDANGVVAVGQGTVIDKTAPTAKPEPMDYFVIKKPSTLPFEAKQLLRDLDDTNPLVEEENITAKFLNEADIKTGLTKVGTFDAKIEMSDPAGNTREITVPINVVQNRLIVEAVDSTVFLSDIANHENGETTLKDEDVVKAVVADSSDIQVSYIAINGGKVELTEEDFAIEGNNFEISGNIEPKIGQYPLKITANYTIIEEVDEKEVQSKVSNSTEFVLTVIDADGKLSLTGSGDLSAETKISTKPQDISLENAVNIQVENTSFDTDSWTLETKADPFVDSKGNTGFPLSLIYVDNAQHVEFDVSSGPVQIDHSSDREKSFTFEESGDNNFFMLRTASASSNWATDNETYQTTINWTLTGSSTSVFNIADKLIVKGK